MTDNITFERFERDSNANKQARQKSNSPRLTYDFKVLIEGEYRAVMCKEIFGKGYRIYDPDRRPLHKAGEREWHPKHLGSEIDKQADFFQVVKDMLDNGLIPTLAELQAKREQEAAKAIQDDKDARKAVRDRIASRYGPELLEMLKLVHPILEGVNRRCTNETVMIQQVRALIAKAEDVGSNFEEAVEQEKWSMRHR